MSFAISPFLVHTLPGNGLDNGSRMPLPFLWSNNDIFLYDICLAGSRYNVQPYADEGILYRDG